MFIDTHIKTFRIALVRYRQRARLSQSELALRCGISSSMISQFEQGVQKNMSLKTFLKIVRVLHYMNTHPPAEKINNQNQETRRALPAVTPNLVLGWDALPCPSPAIIEPIEKLPSYYLWNDFHKLK